MIPSRVRKLYYTCGTSMDNFFVLLLLEEKVSGGDICWDDGLASSRRYDRGDRGDGGLLDQLDDPLPEGEGSGLVSSTEGRYLASSLLSSLAEGVVEVVEQL